jgi:hypothetical protein
MRQVLKIKSLSLVIETNKDLLGEQRPVLTLAGYIINKNKSAEIALEKVSLIEIREGERDVIVSYKRRYNLEGEKDLLLQPELVEFRNLEFTSSYIESRSTGAFAIYESQLDYLGKEGEEGLQLKITVRYIKPVEIPKVYKDTILKF